MGLELWRLDLGPDLGPFTFTATYMPPHLGGMWEPEKANLGGFNLDRTCVYSRLRSNVNSHSYMFYGITVRDHAQRAAGSRVSAA